MGYLVSCALFSSGSGLGAQRRCLGPRIFYKRPLHLGWGPAIAAERIVKRPRPFLLRRRRKGENRPRKSRTGTSSFHSLESLSFVIFCWRKWANSFAGRVRTLGRTRGGPEPGRATEGRRRQQRSKGSEQPSEDANATPSELGKIAQLAPTLP